MFGFGCFIKNNVLSSQSRLTSPTCRSCGEWPRARSFKGSSNINFNISIHRNSNNSSNSNSSSSNGSSDSSLTSSNGNCLSSNKLWPATCWWTSSWGPAVAIKPELCQGLRWEWETLFLTLQLLKSSENLWAEGTVQTCWITTVSNFGGGANDTFQESNIINKTGFMVKIGQKDGP